MEDVAREEAAADREKEGRNKEEEMAAFHTNPLLDVGGKISTNKSRNKSGGPADQLEFKNKFKCTFGKSWMDKTTMW